MVEEALFIQHSIPEEVDLPSPADCFGDVDME